MKIISNATYSTIRWNHHFCRQITLWKCEVMKEYLPFWVKIKINLKKISLSGKLERQHLYVFIRIVRVYNVHFYDFSLNSAQLIWAIVLLCVISHFFQTCRNYQVYCSFYSKAVVMKLCSRLVLWNVFIDRIDNLLCFCS